MNILCHLERVARRTPDAVALRSNESEWTFRELLDSSSRFAGFLVGEGTRPGDRVALYLPNDPHFLIATFGAWAAGATAVPMNYLFGPQAIRRCAEDSGARFVVALPGDVEHLRSTLHGLPMADGIVSTTPAPDTFSSMTQVLDTSPPLATTVPRLDSDDAVLMYTSGSSGVPKGVRQTHRNVVAASEATADRWGTTEADHALLCVPLFHVGGLQLVTMPALLRGATVTMMARWRTDTWLDIVERHHVTIAALVSTMLIDVGNRLSEAPRQLGSLRVCTLGGSRTPPAPIKRFADATGVVPIDVYGQTEQNGLACTYWPGDVPAVGCIGRPLEQIVQWRVTDFENRNVPVGEVGELLVRGDAVTPGYWQRDDANKEKFVDGWFRTGDLVRADAEGYLHYVERLDDLIVSGGENIYPQVVERHLADCPLISQVVIIGTPHSRLVEQVTAIIVPREPAVDVASIEAYCRDNPDLRGLQSPKRFELIDAMPLTGSGKVDRPGLKRRYSGS